VSGHRWRVGLRGGARTLPAFVEVEAATVLAAIKVARETRRDAHGTEYAYRLGSSS
jgi:hypothetical protein